MTIADEISREVVFTDYACAEEVRPVVTVSIHLGKPVAIIGKMGDDIDEPNVLRAFGACLNAAADEMERMSA